MAMMGVGGMERSEILREIAAYCQLAGLAESTFGRRAVNDGKLVARIRDGGRISERTLKRIRGYIDANPPDTHDRRHPVIRAHRAPPSRVAMPGARTR